ncbi:MAG TPA: Ku protein [Solirubrobacteraceae bacterium]|jgi:DNA end-binding protein Ku
MPHSLWNGTVAFATVRVPVKLYAATESKTVRFRERHVSDGAAIEHRRVCIEEDKEVPYKELVKGVETSAGRYVVLTKEEIAAADGPAARTIEVEHFVRREEIDPVYYAHVYYLGPGAHGEDGYRLLHGAMKRSDRVGIGRFVFHNKAQLVAMRALGEVIALHTMHFADEIVPPHSPDDEDGGQQPSKRETQVAGTLVEQLESRFQPHRYKDTYRDAVLDLIARKASGETIEIPQEEQETDEGDLLAALEESVRMHGGKGKSGTGKTARKRTAASSNGSKSRSAR